MNIKRYIIAGLFTTLITTTVHAGQNACITCHESLGGTIAAPVIHWKGSIHSQNGVTCNSCHGGNPDVKTGNIKFLSPAEFSNIQAHAMSKASGFIGIPSGKTMFDMCGKCHTDSVNMYANSIMGVAYLENKGGPSCATCHNSHDNVIPAVPKVCEQCHKDITGFDQISPMNVSDATIHDLSMLRIHIEQKKVEGNKLPIFSKELASFQIGFVAWGAVLLLLIVSFIIYIVLEKRS
ncbi:MAG: cytochrome c3 family protein [Deltaproteobacteria bacterium]|nr:cytochrome c3 family protein [Deltaproteobacteria bacterium]MCL5793068.1 cytochrome c3 family protein [Deltaproteobacteria bacterium]